jgi:putative ABC transport system permease protein
VTGMLFGIDPTDVTSAVIAVAVLSASAMIAAWIPARRASRVDPTLALRSQ